MVDKTGWDGSEYYSHDTGWGINPYGNTYSRTPPEKKPKPKSAEVKAETVKEEDAKNYNPADWALVEKNGQYVNARVTTVEEDWEDPRDRKPAKPERPMPKKPGEDLEDRVNPFNKEIQWVKDEKESGFIINKKGQKGLFDS